MSTRMVLKLVILAVVAVVVPACGSGSQKKMAPVIVFTSPTPLANTSRQPIIYVRFDKALDPATVNATNVELGVVGGGAIAGITVTYNAQLFEIRIVPPAALGNAAGATVVHRVLLHPGILSSVGTSIGSTLFFDFNVPPNADGARPVFGGVDGVGTITQTSIELNWTPEATDAVSFDHYDIFMATQSGFEDLTVRFDFTTGPSPRVVGGLAANTTYFFIVRAVDAAGNNDGNTVEITATTLP